jgi:uncharacterized membrane protein
VPRQRLAFSAPVSQDTRRAVEGAWASPWAEGTWLALVFAVAGYALYVIVAFVATELARHAPVSGDSGRVPGSSGGRGRGRGRSCRGRGRGGHVGCPFPRGGFFGRYVVFGAVAIGLGVTFFNTSVHEQEHEKGWDTEE